MGCGREASSGIQQFIEQLKSLQTPPRAVVIAAPNIEEVGKAFRALAIAFGQVETRTDEEIFREARRMFGINDELEYRVFYAGTQTGKISKDWFDEVGASTVRFQKLLNEPSWTRPHWALVSEYRNLHDDQQARIKAHQKWERNKSVPVNGKKIPRRRFT
jgi:hypothetical protein